MSFPVRVLPAVPAPSPVMARPATSRQNRGPGRAWIGKLCLASLGGLLSIAAPLYADEYSDEMAPFSGRSLNPLTQIYGLPDATLPQRLEAGRIQFGLDQNLANSFSQQHRAGESLIIDGELWRTDLNLGIGLPAGWRLDLELPYIHHGKGRLDGPIESWHQALGLPNGGREKRPRDALLYQYSQNGGTPLRMERTRHGLGDLQLRASQAWPRETREVFLGLGVKLPIGDAERLTGSGATDLSASLALRDSQSLAAYGISWFGGAGLAYLGETETGLASIQRRWAWTSHAGGGWQALPGLRLVAQLDHHSALYHSRLRAIGGHTLQFTLGLQGRLSRNLRLDIAFSEDLITTASPDFRLLAAIRQGF